MERKRGAVRDSAVLWLNSEPRHVGQRKRHGNSIVGLMYAKAVFTQTVIEPRKMYKNLYGQAAVLGKNLARRTMVGGTVT